MINQNDTSEIEHQIRMFISQNMLFSEDGFHYSDDDSFLQQGIIDSLGVMQLVEFVEKDLKVSIEQDEITPENFDSVNKLATLIRRKLSTKPQVE